MLTGRNLLHIEREPLQLSDVTVQPVLFTLLFVYVFGSGVDLPGGGSYKDFAIAGLLAMNLTTSAMGTAVGLSTDLGSGVIDRFRTLPMWRPAVLVGRSLADLMTAAICAAFVAVHRAGRSAGGPTPSLASVARRVRHLPALQLRPLMGLRLPGHGQQEPRVRAGHRPRDPVPPRDRLQRAGPDRAHARLLRTIANWNPVSAVTAAGRQLFGNPNPSAAIHAWPMQHPVLASLLWSVALIGDLRAAGQQPVPAPHDRLKPRSASGASDIRNCKTTRWKLALETTKTP